VTPLSISFMPYSDITEKAREFLQSHKVPDKIPVDIEAIIENYLGMNIIPFPNLQRNFSVEGFSSSDFSDIYVDEHIYSNVQVRYRFTLAHEVGHYVLHRHLLSHIGVNSIEEWKQFIDQVDPEDYGRMEFQGYAFAGLILVPPDHLSRQFDENLFDVEELIRKAKGSGFDRKTYLEYAQEAMTRKLAPLFDVSPAVISKRIGYDELDRRFS